jgi:predicted Rossmann-fold nucleotide-binding protein
VALKSVCVFCGSSVGRRVQFAGAAEALGTLLAQRNIRLVYGGANRGLMTIVADSASPREDR